MQPIENGMNAIHNLSTLKDSVILVIIAGIYEELFHFTLYNF